MAQEWRGQREGGPPSQAQLRSIVGLGLNQDGTAGPFGIAITSIAARIAGPPAPWPPPGVKKLQLVNFIAGKTSGESIGAKWSTTNDPVMGGVSTGNFSIQVVSTTECGIWEGDVKVVPKLQQPGFCRVDAKLTSLLGKDFSEYDGLTYNLILHGGPTATMMAVIEGGLLERWQFAAELHAPASDTLEAVFVPFSAFKPFGIRPEPGNGPSKQQLKHLTSVGVLADGTAGKFHGRAFQVDLCRRQGRRRRRQRRALRWRRRHCSVAQGPGLLQRLRRDQQGGHVKLRRHRSLSGATPHSRRLSRRGAARASRRTRTAITQAASSRWAPSRPGST